MRFKEPRYINLDDFINWEKYKSKVVLSSDNIIIKNAIGTNLCWKGNKYHEFTFMFKRWTIEKYC